MIFGLSSEEQRQLSRKVEPAQAFAKKPERIRTIVRDVAEHYFYDRPTHLMSGERLARRYSCRTVKRISFWLFGSSERCLLQKTRRRLAKGNGSENLSSSLKSVFHWTIYKALPLLTQLSIPTIRRHRILIRIKNPCLNSFVHITKSFQKVPNLPHF
jgi:hypothetical protein